MIEKLTYMGFVFTLLLIGCGEVVEKDISDKEVVLLAPSDGAELDSGNVSLWWEPVDGASGYQLSLVSPGFTNAVYLIEDTATSSNVFEVSLNPGEYEWSVSAFNNGYATDFFVAGFTVLDTVTTTDTDISDDVIDLLTPANEATLTADSITFWWEDLPGAESYELLVVDPDFDNPQEVVSSVETTGTLIKVLLDSGSYEWGVRGVSAGGQTQFSIRSLKVE